MIALGKIVQTAADVAFDLVGEIVLACSYKQINDAGFNATAGTTTPTFTTAAVNAIFLGFSQKETDGVKVRTGDKRVFIKGSEIGSIEPNVDDVIVETVALTQWQVINIEIDPTRKLFAFQVRKVTT